VADGAQIRIIAPPPSAPLHNLSLVVHAAASSMPPPRVRGSVLAEQATPFGVSMLGEEVASLMPASDACDGLASGLCSPPASSFAAAPSPNERNARLQWARPMKISPSKLLPSFALSQCFIPPHKRLQLTDCKRRRAEGKTLRALAESVSAGDENAAVQLVGMIAQGGKAVTASQLSTCSCIDALVSFLTCAPASSELRVPSSSATPPQNPLLRSRARVLFTALGGASGASCAALVRCCNIIIATREVGVYLQACKLARRDICVTVCDMI